MPDPSNPWAVRVSNSDKILIYSIFTLLCGVFTYSANYAMIFRITASVVSLISVFGVIGWCITGIRPRFRKGPDSRIWLTLISLYSLNRWFIAGTLLTSVLFSKKLKPVLQHHSENGEQGKRLPPVPELVFSGPIFLVMDIVREYSVWHHFEFRLFPWLGCMVSGALAFYFLTKSKSKP